MRYLIVVIIKKRQEIRKVRRGKKRREIRKKMFIHAFVLGESFGQYMRIF